MRKKNKLVFKPVPSQFNFLENEKKILDWWYKNGVVEKYLAKNKASEKRFVFIDGPITANNPMGIHHAWGRTLKDLYQRYKNMQMFKQRFQNGFDCQGLWVEVEVEKEKGFKTKKEIESYGIEKFVQDCKDRVEKYSRIQTEQSKRLGYFMDWDHSYFTMSEENNYMIWAFLKKCWQEGILYKGNDSVPWCPRCGTAISNQEILDGGYKQLTHDSVYMRFPVYQDGRLQENEFLLVWTTTPWTIPADTLVAVSPEIEYAKVLFEGKCYWLAKNLIERVFGQKLTPTKLVNGEQLINQEKITKYQGPFDDLPMIKKIAENSHCHQIVLAKDLVTESEGTGLVHIVPGAGTEDHHLVKNDLGWKDLIFPVVDETGAYLKGYGNLSGKNAKDQPELIIDLMKNNDHGKYLFKVEPYAHQYPLCWRCGMELIWRLVDEWYLSMDHKTAKGERLEAKSLREKMIAVAKKINWLPKFGLKRELDWLKNMGDWMISKKRYWGLALPIWECKKCGHFEVIGSKEELEKRAVEGWDKLNGKSPHKPQIDEVKINCPKCGQLASRVPDVGNPWLDAGIVNFSTLVDPRTGKLSYLTDKKYFNNWYPADLITECFPGQFRNWFYSLIAMSTELEGREPAKTILGHATVKDEKGEEMHKSKGNTIWFDDAAEKMGVDTMRWMYCRQNPEFNLNLGYKTADEVRRQFIFLFWNSYRFFNTYAALSNWSPKNLKSKILNLKSLDRWILSRLESTKKMAEEKLDQYCHQEAIKAIEEFLNDLSGWYVRRSRDRVNPNHQNANDREACFETLYYLLKNLTLILTPFIPYLAETIWQGLHGNDESLSEKDSVHLQDWPKIQNNLIDKELGKQMAFIREVTTLGHAQRKEKQIKVRQPLNKLKVKSEKLKVEEELIQLIKDELNVKEVEIKPGKGNLTVELDTKLTPELEAEGEARELIRQVQVLRQEAKMSLKDKIIIFAPQWSEKWQNEILAKTSAKEIRKGKDLKIKVL